MAANGMERLVFKALRRVRNEQWQMKKSRPKARILKQFV